MRLFFYCLISCFICIASVNAKQLPIKAFANLPETRGVQLSPDGTRLAMWVNLSNGDEILVTQEIGTDKIVPVLETKNTNKKIFWFNWANDQQLVVSVRFYSNYFSYVLLNTRLLVVNHDGSELKSLFTPADFMKLDTMPTQHDRIVDWLEEDPENILVQIGNRAIDPAVLKISLRTGRKSEFKAAKGFTNHWMNDQQNRVRVGTWYHNEGDKTQQKINIFDLEKQNWYTAWEFDTMSENIVHPLGFGIEPNVLFVLAYHEGKLAVFKVDLTTSNLDKKLVYSHPDYDIDASLVYQRGKKNPIGLNFRLDGEMIIWDKAEKKFQKRLSKALGGLAVSVVSYSEDRNRYILYADNISSPGMYYLGDKKARTLSPIAERYPLLRNLTLPTKKQVSYKARDGLNIEGFLSLPDGIKPNMLPTIIFPHGGPFANDDSSFDYWSAFLVNRGYAVFQMNFRGSSGYGYDFMNAGIGNWGTSMQNDIVDGTRWLIEQGITDKNKICIVGGSYGGYAALMGAAKSPELFKCAVSYAGVTDLVQMYVKRGNDKQFRRIVGDSRSLMKNNSPRYLADQMNVPMLIVHADLDSRVNINQARNLKSALEREDKNFVYLEQEGGDHFLSNQKHRIEFFKAMEGFLAKYLK